MSKHRTAMGKTVDMSALIAKNEKTRAVGNMGVNARGDTIDAFGRVVTPNNKKVSSMYSKTVGNKSAQVRHAPKPKVTEELTAEEMEIEAALDEELEIEQIKKQDQERSKKK